MPNILCAALLALPLLVRLPQEDLKAAEKEFKLAHQMQAEKPLADAIRNLLKINSPEAAKVILTAIKGRNDTGVYWTLVRGAGSFSGPEALRLVAEFCLDNKSNPHGRDVTAALQGNGWDTCEAALIPILKGGSEEQRALVLEHMQKVGRKDSIAAVLEMLGTEKNPDTIRRLFRVLQVATCGDYGDSLSNWQGWWEKNKDKPWDQLQAKPGGGGVRTGTACDDLHKDTEYEKLRKGKVLVIGAKTGCKCKRGHDLDNIEHIVQKMGLQLDYVTKAEWPKESVKADEYVAILVNCTHLEVHCYCEKCMKGAGGSAGLRLRQCPQCNCGHPSGAYIMSDAGVTKVRKYVEGGGYLFTEDWAMREIHAKQFKEFITTGPFLPEMEVSILPRQGAASHPYLRRIFVKPPKDLQKGSTTSETDFEKLAHTWKIDNESPAIKITGKDKVTVLIYSNDVGGRAGGEGSDAVAVTFAVQGKGSGPAARDPIQSGAPIPQDRTEMTGGRVLHVMSHFGKQKSQEDEFTIQNLLLNFLIEASERKGIKVEKK